MTAKPRTVLVTGSSGRIGRVLRERLDARDDIRPAYLTSPRDQADGGRVDVTDREQLATATHAARPDAIVHLASITGAACQADPGLARAVNVGSTAIIAELARETGTRRLILASSSAVYGDRYSTPVSEDAPTRARSIYAETKLESERVLAAAAGDGLHTVALRIFNVFGDFFIDSLVYRLLHSTAADPVILNGLTTFVRDYVHVNDVVDAIVASLDAPLRDEHLTINIGSGSAMSNGELIDRLAQEHELHYRVAEGSPSYSCADITLARNVLGYVPAASL